MQSSPPTRTMKRAASPTESRYSIHWDALGALGFESDDSTALPSQKIDRVDSDDIDGPSDFTINMGKWMRGVSLEKKGSKTPPTRSPKISPVPKSAPRARKTPSPPPHNALFQPTVEDYYSSPARIPSQKRASPPPPAEPTLEQQLLELQAKCAHLEKANNTLAQDLEIERMRRIAAEENVQVLKQANTTLTQDVIYERGRKEAAEENAQALQETNTALAQDVKYERGRKEAAEENAQALQKTNTALAQDLRDECMERELAEENAQALELSLEQHRCEPALEQSKTYDETVLHQEVSCLSDELETKQTALNEAVLERDDLQDCLQTTRAALSATQTKLEDTLQALEESQQECLDREAAGFALDARVSDAVQKREIHWQGKVDDLEKELNGLEKELEAMAKERKTMVKALMTMWGREEMGPAPPGQKQKYAYLR